jgi:hypothetical protein
METFSYKTLEDIYFVFYLLNHTSSSSCRHNAAWRLQPWPCLTQTHRDREGAGHLAWHACSELEQEEPSSCQQILEP